MPRKTRKQKERSQRRSQELSTIPSSTPVKREFEFSFSAGKFDNSPKKANKKSDLSIPLDTSRLMVRDLLKTLVVAAGIISLELVLYFAKFK